MDENNKSIAWFDGKRINETIFCEEFAQKHNIIYADNAFFTPDGRITDIYTLKSMVFDEIRYVLHSGAAKTVTDIIETLKLVASWHDLKPDCRHIYMGNGLLDVSGEFYTDKSGPVRNRLPVYYNPDAPAPVTWYRFLTELLEGEDIVTLQEFMGYCLIPSNKGQRMLIIKGSGGEGKSQIGTVMSLIFGGSMKDGSIAKISENRFARADLEHLLVMVDDDMKMEALRQTNYVKSIVTAQGKVDLECKGKQSHQGWMTARLMAFSNGDLQSLYDKSDGFYRRQLVLKTKPRDPNRVDDPDLGEKFRKESEGIFLWMFEGLQRLIANSFRFTISSKSKENIELAKRDGNNIIRFMEAEDYVSLSPGDVTTSKDLYEAYVQWCGENAEVEVRQRSFSSYLIANQEKYGLVYSNNMMNRFNRRVWGFKGIRTLV